MLQWKLRAVKSETTVSNRRTWNTRCNKFSVSHVVPKLTGDRTPYFLAIERWQGCHEHMISRHTTRNAAAKACEEQKKKDDAHEAKKKEESLGR